MKSFWLPFAGTVSRFPLVRCSLYAASRLKSPTQDLVSVAPAAQAPKEMVRC